MGVYSSLPHSLPRSQNLALCLNSDTGTVSWPGIAPMVNANVSLLFPTLARTRPGESPDSTVIWPMSAPVKLSFLTVTSLGRSTRRVSLPHLQSSSMRQTLEKLSRTLSSSSVDPELVRAQCVNWLNNNWDGLIYLLEISYALKKLLAALTLS